VKKKVNIMSDQLDQTDQTKQLQQRKPGGRSVTGQVVSNKMERTIVVKVESKHKHPLYGKYMKSFSKMVAHDDANQCQIGDTVMIKQSRPLSKTKHWVLVKIIEKNEQDALE
jgi:small subunit ribosomal protein S17